jgi:hypothetical protein
MLASRPRGRLALPTPHIFVFQPLMGNGNASQADTAGGRTRASNPSWGTGTVRGRQPQQPVDLLPTPHGERERASGHRLGAAGRASNPSWGTGTSTSSTISVQPTFFQPLMGNGNPTAAANLDESKSNWLSRNGRERDAVQVQRSASSASLPIELEAIGCRNRIYGGYPPAVSGSLRCVHPCSTQ